MRPSVPKFAGAARGSKFYFSLIVIAETRQIVQCNSVRSCVHGSPSRFVVGARRSQGATLIARVFTQRSIPFSLLSLVRKSLQY